MYSVQYAKHGKAIGGLGACLTGKFWKIVATLLWDYIQVNYVYN